MEEASSAMALYQRTGNYFENWHWGLTLIHEKPKELPSVPVGLETPIPTEQKANPPTVLGPEDSIPSCSVAKNMIISAPLSNDLSPLWQILHLWAVPQSQGIPIPGCENHVPASPLCLSGSHHSSLTLTNGP